MGKLAVGRILIVPVWLLALAIPGLGGPFALFPKTGRLVSPDGRFEIRDVEQVGAAGQFVGTFRSLWLTELATGRSRKLCDYLGVAAVAWSNKNSVLMTQYVGKKSSRAVAFPAADRDDSLMIDSNTLIQLLDVKWRPSLRENDHLFVEASSLEGDRFQFRVWGYGKHDPNGFRWNCEYAMSDGKTSCAARSGD